ncbi:hypothetical protein ACU3L3_07185 [Priestia endophytica]
MSNFNMSFLEASKVLKQGGATQSEESKTTYELCEKGLIISGDLVDFSYLTEKEIEGKWREVNIIGDDEELTPEEIQNSLDDAIDQLVFHEKHRQEQT